MTKRKVKKESRNTESPFVTTMIYCLTPKSEDSLRILGDEILAWAKLPTSIRFKDFLNEKVISWTSWTDYCGRSKYLAECAAVAKDMVASRREKGAMAGDFSPQIIGMTFGMNDVEYKEYTKWKTDISKKDESKSDERIIVQIMPYPESDIVPQRIIEEQDGLG